MEASQRKKFNALVCFILAVIVGITSISSVISASNKRIERFNKEAGIVCTKYIAEYGDCKYDLTETTSEGDEYYSMRGVCAVREMDFDDNKKSELMICFSDNGKYTLEIWGFHGGDFQKLYSSQASHGKKDTDGSFIAFYRKNNKYFILKNSQKKPEEFGIYSLSGKEFSKKKDTAHYDFFSGSVTLNEKDITNECELITLSGISQAKASRLQDKVEKGISNFIQYRIDTAEIAKEKTPEERRNEAYYGIIEKYNEKYGFASVKTDGRYAYIDGLGVAQLIDFNNDSKQELLLVYRRNKKVNTEVRPYSDEYVLELVPTYYLEVWNFDGNKANLLYSNEGISSGVSNDSQTRYYILESKGNKINICSNTASYSENNNKNTFISKRMTLENDSFKVKYKSEIRSNYGYKYYYVNDERIYNEREFNEKGYDIPLFMDKNKQYNSSVFEITYMEALLKYKDDMENTVLKTRSNIKKLNPDYTGKSN